MRPVRLRRTRAAGWWGKGLTALGRRVAAMGVLGLLLAGFPRAEEPLAKPGEAAAGGEQEDVIRSRVFVVNLFISAMADDEYVGELKESDFEVTEDGKPQELLYFRNLSQTQEIPLTIVVLVDTSGSVKDKLAQEVATASIFFKKILRPNKDVAALAEFHSEVVLVQDFTDNMDRLDAALDKLKPGGETSLYDAVFLASEEKLTGEAGRKIILILSDGADTSSKVSKDVAIKAAQRVDALIYGIGVRSASYPSDFSVLETFAKETGGRFFTPEPTREALEKVFGLIMKDIQHQYNIAYEPQNLTRNGEFRKIKVSAKGKRLKLFYRKGYFAPEE